MIKRKKVHNIQQGQSVSISQQAHPSVPTISSKVEVSPATGDSDARPSNLPLCRVFLIVIASLIIGGVVGSALTYLWMTRQGPEEDSFKNIIPTATSKSCPACPSCQTCQEFPTCPECPICQECQSCPKCPTCQTCPEFPTCPECPICQKCQSCPKCPKCQICQECPTCPVCPTCQTCPTCPTCPKCQRFSAETDFPMDCQEVMSRGNHASGKYMILPSNSERAFPVWCDMETDGGGWTVFQRRRDGSVNFYLGWADYVSGFGNINSEHWLGNQKIHQITSQGNYELRIDMSDFEGNSAYAKYSTFKIGGLDSNYMLTASGYSGDAGDSLSVHSNIPFTTKDSDYDLYDGNCATKYEGAWWYTNCHTSNLNGKYLKGKTETFANGVVWQAWKNYHYSLKVSVMKMRQVA